MKSNFNSETLLCNRPITIIDKRGGIYNLVLPTLRDKLDNIDYDIFIGFCATSLEEIAVATGRKFRDKFHLFKEYKKNNVDILPVLDKYFAKYMIGFKYVDDSLYWGNRLVSKEIFEAFCNYCAIASGAKSLDDLELIITDDMDEFEKQRIRNEIRIRKTKAKAASENTAKKSSLTKILAGVCHEFGLSYNQLLDMTLYSIYFMYSQLGHIMNYEITNVAAGNGLLKRTTKHNHWAD